MRKRFMGKRLAAALLAAAVAFSSGNFAGDTSMSMRQKRVCFIPGQTQ